MKPAKFKRSNLEERFANLLDKYKVPYEEQHYFAPPRKWRGDFLVVIGRRKYLIEVQGVVFGSRGNRGGHQTVTGLRNDCAKNLAAVKNHYIYLTCTNGGECSIEVMAEFIRDLWKKHKRKK